MHATTSMYHLTRVTQCYYHFTCYMLHTTRKYYHYFYNTSRTTYTSTSCPYQGYLVHAHHTPCIQCIYHAALHPSTIQMLQVLSLHRQHVVTSTQYLLHYLLQVVDCMLQSNTVTTTLHSTIRTPGRACRGPAQVYAWYAQTQQLLVRDTELLLHVNTTSCSCQYLLQHYRFHVTSMLVTTYKYTSTLYTYMPSYRPIQAYGIHVVQLELLCSKKYSCYVTYHYTSSCYQYLVATRCCVVNKQRYYLTHYIYPMYLYMGYTPCTRHGIASSMLCSCYVDVTSLLPTSTPHTCSGSTQW